MRNKKIIWSLFDSETAITQELNSDKYKVFSIGIASDSAITNNFIEIDLSKKSCLKKLSKLPKPYIIFASPPCESWVRLNIGNVRFYSRNYNEHNLYWQKNYKRNDFTEKHKQLRLQGQKTAYWTMSIIKEFNPALWCIENGASSFIFDYLNRFFNLKGYKNRVRYSAYDNINFSEKPTIFYSNKKFQLRNHKVQSKKLIQISKNTYKRVKNSLSFQQSEYNDVRKYIIEKENREFKKSYSERSEVPIGIYRDILYQFEHNPYPTLFD